MSVVYVTRQLLNDCGIGVCGTEAAEAPVVNQHRVLLFCQLKMMLDIVEQDLFRSDLSALVLNSLLLKLEEKEAMGIKS